MSRRGDIIGETGLQFYGKMSASLSHEIKNALAIVNEHAGLLEDFAQMADGGRPIDPERLKGLAGKVIKQIRRADRIVMTMNRFAHSIDESVMDVDLGDVLVFMARLSGRLAAMRGVTLETKPAPSPVTITTSLFFLENLISLCLDFAVDAAGEGKSLGLIAEDTDSGAHVRVTGVEGLAEVPVHTFPAEREKALLAVLGAELAVDAEAAELVLSLPRSMDKAGIQPDDFE